MQTCIIDSVSFYVKDYGGDLKKRWYVDCKLKTYGRRKKNKRVWVTQAPDLAARFRHIEEIKATLQRYADSETRKSKPPAPAKSKFLLHYEKALATRPDLAKKTVQTYTTAARHFDRFLTKTGYDYTNPPETALTEFQIFGNFTPAYFKALHSHLRNIYSILKGNKQIKANPFAGLKLRLRPADSDKHEPFSDVQKQILEPYLRETAPALFLATRFVFYAYLRPDELLSLRVSDIDLRTRTIRIAAENTKVKRSDNLPIIAPLLTCIIDSGVLNNPANYFLFGAGGVPGPERCGKNTLTSQHREALQAVGIYTPRVTTLYSWKHTGNIYAALRGIDIRLIQQLNRHKSIKTTEIYQRRLGVFQQGKFAALEW